MRHALLVAACTLAAACQDPAEPPPQTGPAPLHPLAVQLRESTGQSIYVPVYSHIYVRDESRIFPLTVTVSVRNTDLHLPIHLVGVHYYDSEGQLLHSYVEKPVPLGRLASVEYVIRETDTRGGAGANFIVDWTSDEAVTEPIVEAVMIGTESQQGISFVSTGRIIAHHDPAPQAPPPPEPGAGTAPSPE